MNTPETQEHYVFSMRKRRAWTIFFLLIMLTIYALPRGSIWYASRGSFDAHKAPRKLYAQFLSKAQWVQTFKDWPGHKKAAKESYTRLQMKVSRSLKKGGRHTLYSSYVAPQWSLKDKRTLQALCTHNSGLLQTLLSSQKDVLEQPMLLHYTRLSQLRQGNTATLAHIGQKVSHVLYTKNTTIQRKHTYEQLRTLLFTDQLALAEQVIQKTLHHWPEHSLSRRHLERVMCSIRASLRRRPDLRRIQQHPHCQAVWSWHFLRQQKTQKAMELLYTTGGYVEGKLPPSRSLFFVSILGRIQDQRWQDAQRLWRAFRLTPTHTEVVRARDVFQLFHSAYRMTVPPSLLRRLQRVVEAHQWRTPSPEWSAFLNWIRLIRARQMLRTGQPTRAIQMYNVLRSATSKYSMTAEREWVGIIELLKGADAALHAWKIKRYTTSHRMALSAYFLSKQRYTSARRYIQKQPSCEQMARQESELCFLQKWRIQTKKEPSTSKKKGLQQWMKTIRSTQTRKLLRQLSGSFSKYAQGAKPSPHMSSVSSDIRSFLFVLKHTQHTDASWIDTLKRWSCQSRTQAVDGLLMLAYIRERRWNAKKGVSSARVQARTQRRHLGQIVHRVEELWLSPALSTWDVH